MDIALVFIAHDEVNAKRCIETHPTAYVIFVGPNDVSPHPRILVARNLQDNIEHERKLLTFTAWYAIIKNKLFLYSTYICILEYDVTLPPNFYNNILKLCSTSNTDLVAFLSNDMYFLHDIYYDVFIKYLKIKNIDCADVSRNMLWYLSTNYCMKREIMEEFVDWYYPSCLEIKKEDSLKFSWYHERVFNMFRKHKKYTITILNGLGHSQSKSHVLNNINENKNINVLGKVSILGT